MLTRRTSSGQSMIVLTTIIAFFVLLSAGLFSFELNRMEVARQQLKTATEAAALAGAATLASSDNTDAAQSQQDAMDTALNTFQNNSIIGKTLAAAIFTYANPDNPAADAASLFIEFLDPNNNNTPVSLGDPKGKTVRITSFFGLQPAFGKYLGINKVTLIENSSGGVPQLDIVLCFDISASIDDQTMVTFVKRTWDPTNNKTIYTVTSTQSGSPAGTLAQGTIFDIIGPPATGSAVDALPPQTLSSSNQGTTYPLTFSEAGGAAGLRGKQETGFPPGNYPGTTWGTGAGTGNTHVYTDLVANLDGLKQFKGTTYNGYAFPDLATLVEASRGNLDNQTAFTNSKASVSVPNTITWRAGYKGAYQQAAKQLLHPLKDAQDACQTFLQIMNNDCDAHFCLDSFTSTAGSSATDTITMANVDGNYSSAGSGNFPTPLIPLNSSTTISNFTTCYNWLPQTTATSGTNIGDALNTAVAELTTHSRKGARKAIVLFTDGQPTSAGPLDTSDPWRNARLAAVKAKNAGIPIYSVGLAQTPAIIPGETAILTDQNSDPNAGGVSGIAGHGGKFFLVTKNSDLRKTFENIARQLVQLVK